MVKVIIACIFFVPIYLALIFIYIAIVFLDIILFFAGKIFFSKIVDAYTYKQIIAVDQALNALTAGDEDETISGRVGRRIPDSWFAKMLNKIYFWQKNHVVEAIEPDEGKEDLIN